MLPQGAWIWGTYEERLNGGFPIRMLADSILPYSVPDPAPSWWEGSMGQFEEGFQRNMAGDADGLPNYPTTRGLSAVMVTMLGLKQSESAPFRFTLQNNPTIPEKAQNDAVWPFDFQASQPTWTPVPALDVLKWYANIDPAKYLATNTQIIVTIPERDVMNAIGATSDGPRWSIPPNNEDGEVAIDSFVTLALLPISAGGLGLGASILGWYLIDEPDIINRRRWATPIRLARLRMLIKEAEYRVRVTTDPVFAALPLAEQIKRLRPVIITLTIPFFMREPGAVDIQKYVTASVNSELLGPMKGAADIFGFDWYPFKRSQGHINLDYPTSCPEPPPVENAAYTLVDPVRSLRTFRELRLLLNGTLEPGDENYRGVFVWSQTDGWPFRIEGDPISADRSPANISTDDIDACLTAIGRRTKRYPSLREQQYYNWESQHELSEGTAGFSQTNAPDLRLRDEFSLVAKETEFFAGARYSSVNRSAYFEIAAIGHGTPAAGDPRDRMPPRILFFDYLNQPTSSLGTSNRWLVIINRHFLRLAGVLRFNHPIFPAGFRFQRVNFLSPVGSPIPVNASNGFTFQVDVPPYAVRIYQLRP